MLKPRCMKQFAKGFFISFYLKAIGSIFVLFLIDITSIDVTELFDLSENNKNMAPFRKIFAKM